MCRVRSAPRRVMHAEDRGLEKSTVGTAPKGNNWYFGFLLRARRSSKSLCFFPTYGNMCSDRNLIMTNVVGCLAKALSGSLSYPGKGL